MSTQYLRRLTVLPLVALFAVACGGSAGSGSAKDTAPIRIGFQAEQTGTFAANGKDLLTGWNLGIKDAGGSVNGRKIETVVVDEAGDPNQGLTSARQVVEQQKVDLLVGPQAANVALAVRAYVASSGIPAVFPGCGIEPVSGQVTPNLVLTGWTCDQPTLGFGKYVHDVLGYKHLTTVGMDYAFGWQVVGGFVNSFKRAGGTIDKQIWTAITASDYSPYIGDIPTNTQAVFTLMAGAAAPRFTSVYKSYGLKDRIPLIGAGTMTDYSVVPSESPDAITGLVTALQYADGLTTPANEKFVQEFQAVAGKFPSYYAEDGYTTAELVVDTLKKVNGNTSNRAAIVMALRHATVDAPRGKVTINPDTNSPVQNIYIRKVEIVNGAPRNVVISTINQVEPWGPLTKSEWDKIAANYQRT